MSGDGHQSIPRDLYPTRMIINIHKPHIQSSFTIIFYNHLLTMAICSTINPPAIMISFGWPGRYRIKGMATSAGSRLFLYTGVPFKEVEMSLDIFTAGCFIFVRGLLTLKKSLEQTWLAGKSPINRGLNRKIVYYWWIFHCHVWLPEGNSTPTRTNDQLVVSGVFDVWFPYQRMGWWWAQFARSKGLRGS